MRLPRDLRGVELAMLLSRYGYGVTRQTGSHMRLTTAQRGEHHVTVPSQSTLRVGTLSAILTDVAAHLQISRQELMQELFGK